MLYDVCASIEFGLTNISVLFDFSYFKQTNYLIIGYKTICVPKLKQNAMFHLCLNH